MGNRYDVPMNVVAFNGSARLEGNTALLVREVFQELQAAGIGTELVQLAGKTLHGCRACYACFEKKNGRCAWDDDFVNACIARMAGADGIILASPTYYTDVSAEMKALIDRAGVVAVRRSGAIHAFDTLNHFFLISEMVIPGSSYWNIGIGREKDEAAGDEEGAGIMRDLGRNMAWLLHKIRS